jgi:hypothetical protein
MIESHTIDVIKSIIERSGDIHNACIAASIDLRTFANWLKEYPEFKVIVDDAKETYKNSLVTSWDLSAIAYTDSLLKGKQVRRKTVRRFVLPKPQLEDDEEFLPPESSDLVEIYREVIEEELHPPKWLLERYLPREQEKPIKVEIDFGIMPDLSEDDPEAKELD